jgi:hypothetical protein
MMTKHFATLVGAAAGAAAVAWAPLAAAEPNQERVSCQSAGQTSTVCWSRGDVEIIHTPPHIQYNPYGQPPPIAG